MRKLAASLLAALPLFVSAQDAQPSATAPSAAPPAQPQPAQAQPPPQYPPQYAPPPQYTPPPPQGQYAPPPQYAPPQGQYAPPPQYAPQYAPPPPQYAPPAPRPARQRSPWYAGFAIGGGDASLRLPGTASTPKGTYSLHDFFGKGPTTFGFDLHVGATLTPRLLLGGELTVFAAAAEYDTPFGKASRSIGIQNLNAVATFFPFGTGLFLRGGLGLSGISSTVDEPGPGKSTDTARGGDVALGVGYAFWLGQRFNLTANLDWSRQSYSSNEIDGSAFWRFGVGFGWF